LADVREAVKWISPASSAYDPFNSLRHEWCILEIDVMKVYNKKYKIALDWVSGGVHIFGLLKLITKSPR